MKILIGADYMPGILDQGKVNEYKNGLFSKDIKEAFADSDFRVLNLENPVTTNDKPILKCGKNNKTSACAIDILKELRIDLLALANNHILDYGEQGLFDTIAELDKQSISHFGAGRSIEEAIIPYIIESPDGQRIGFFNCCEHEFSVATHNSVGANPYDPLTAFDQISKIKKNCDCVIVLFHGGKEYYPYPTPELQRVCRKFIDSGTDLAVVQHTHCIGCNEEYNNGLIVYGQGNFFSIGKSKIVKPESLLIEYDTKTKKTNYIPFQRKSSGLSLLYADDANRVLSDFWRRSEQIKNPDFVEKAFNDQVRHEALYYSGQFAKDHNLFDKVANKLTRGKYRSQKSKKFFSIKKSLVLQNIIECETHREFILALLKQLIKDNDK